jgi:glycerophosphoryl diester phosphodiesterase
MNARQLSIPGKPKPYVMAHRGNSAACPENTLAAFRRALADGADIIETDLHLTADDVFVCIHDGEVDRTTDGHGPVAAMTLAQVKTLSASYGRSAFATERVPSLAELCELLASEAPGVALALELKTDRFLEPDVCRKLADELAATGMLDRTVVLSFSLARVQAVAAAAPDMPKGFITMSKLTPKGVDAQLIGAFWPVYFLNPFYVRQAHAAGQITCPLDPTPGGRLWYYRWLGCDAVLANDPAATIQALGRKLA